MSDDPIDLLYGTLANKRYPVFRYTDHPDYLCILKYLIPLRNRFGRAIHRGIKAHENFGKNRDRENHPGPGGQVPHGRRQGGWIPPISIGLWSITSFGIPSGLPAIGEAGDSRGIQRGHGIGRAFGVPAALLGSVVMTYMGTEQEETNTPVWASAHPLMSPFYAVMGISNATAALSLAAEATGAGDSIKLRLNTLSLVSGSAELVLATMIDRRWSRLPETRFYGDSLYAPLFRHGYMKAGVIYPLVLNTLYLFPYGRSPARTIPAALARMAGVLLVQFLMIYAGRDSGDHAEEYFEYAQPDRQLDQAGAENPEDDIVPAGRESSLLTLIAGAGFLAAGALVLWSKRR